MNKANRPWKKAEISDLTKNYKKYGRSAAIDTHAELYGRSRTAIEQRLFKLGLVKYRKEATPYVPSHTLTKSLDRLAEHCEKDDIPDCIKPAVDKGGSFGIYSTGDIPGGSLQDHLSGPQFQWKETPDGRPYTVTGENDKLEWVYQKLCIGIAILMFTSGLVLGLIL